MAAVMVTVAALEVVFAVVRVAAVVVVGFAAALVVVAVLVLVFVVVVVVPVLLLFDVVQDHCMVKNLTELVLPMAVAFAVVLTTLTSAVLHRQSVFRY